MGSIPSLATKERSEIMDIVITTFCNLKCSKCANLLYLYNEPQHMNLEDLKNDMTIVYDLIHPDHFNILGGETFLYPELIELLLYAQDFGVENIYVYTNGTVDLDLSSLSGRLSSKVKFYIQDYPKSIAKDKIVGQCKEYGFNYEVLKYSWIDYGNLQWCEKGKDRFRSCLRKCWTMLDGKIYMCPRAAHANHLRKIVLETDKYIDLRIGNLQHQYERFLNMEEQSTCSYCFIGSSQEQEIQRGI